MLRIEREDFLIPLEFDDRGRVRREAQGHGLRIHVGVFVITLGVIRKVKTY